MNNKYFILQNTFSQNSYTADSNAISSACAEWILKNSNIECEIAKVRLERHFLGLLGINSQKLIFGAEYFLKFLETLLIAKESGCIALACDSLAVLEHNALMERLFNDKAFFALAREKFGERLDALALPRDFVFLLDLFLERSKLNLKALKPRFSGFKIALVIDLELREKFSQMQIIEQLQSASGAEIVPFFCDCYEYLLLVDKQKAFKMASADYYEFSDSGADFIVVLNCSQITLFDFYAKELQKAAGRDSLGLCAINLAQFLALLQNAPGSILSFSKHKIKPNFI